MHHFAPQAEWRWLGRCVTLLLVCSVLPVDPGHGNEAGAATPTVAADPDEQPITFERDVMAVLSKASCNAGTCHGNVNGKGGFLLSLRGQDVEHDYRQLVHAAAGRRINRMAPAKSLALLKATAQIAHEGGKRFDKNSPEHEILNRWLEEGIASPNSSAPVVTRLEVTPSDSVLWMPEHELPLSVTAVFSDDTRRDVTRLAVYEPSDPRVRVTTNQWASLFTGIDYEIVDNQRRDKLDKHEFVGDQIVQVKSAREEVKNVRTGKPAPPKFLGGDDSIDGDQLEQLASWLTRPDNPMFARAQANRVWYHLMGRGLVEPIDDLRLTNPASHPELLEKLAEELVENHFSLKHLVRTIVLSRSYQLASELDASQLGDAEQYDERLYARAVVRRLTAEQLLDVQSHVLGLPANFEGYPTGKRAGELAGVERVRRKLSDGDVFLRQFGKPERLLACECERSDEPTLGQALSLVGGESLDERLRRPDNRIAKLMAQTGDHREIIDAMFWNTLTRPPTDGEVDAVLELIRTTGDPRAALEDLTWALLNAKELIFRN